MVDPLELRDVFDRAASLPPQERAAFLARSCDGNDGLRREVERLLAADARLGSTFDTDPGSDPATGSIAAAAMSLPPGTRLGPYEIVAAARRRRDGRSLQSSRYPPRSHCRD